MTFNTDKECLPEGIVIPDTIVVFKTGATNKINHQIFNNSPHEIYLDKITYLGNVEIVKSITPLQVKRVAVKKKETAKEQTTVKEFKKPYNIKFSTAVTSAAKRTSFFKV